MPNAIATYATAKGYVQSTYLIITNPIRLQINNDLSFILSYHMLLGFAVELYLKAFLLHKGHADTQLKKHGVSHHLARLLSICEADGMPTIIAKDLVEYLNQQHESFEYRYMKDASSYYIRWQTEVFSELNILNHYVDNEVGASVSQGLTPSSSLWVVPPEFNGWRIPMKL